MAYAHWLAWSARGKSGLSLRMGTMRLGNSGWLSRAHPDNQGGSAVRLTEFRVWLRNSGSYAVHLTEFTRAWLQNSRERINGDLKRVI